MRWRVLFGVYWVAKIAALDISDLRWHAAWWEGSCSGMMYWYQRSLLFRMVWRYVKMYYCKILWMWIRTAQNSSGNCLTVIVFYAVHEWDTWDNYSIFFYLGLKTSKCVLVLHTRMNMVCAVEVLDIETAVRKHKSLIGEQKVQSRARDVLFRMPALPVLGVFTNLTGRSSQGYWWCQGTGGLMVLKDIGRYSTYELRDKITVMRVPIYPASWHGGEVGRFWSVGFILMNKWAVDDGVGLLATAMNTKY